MFEIWPNITAESKKVLSQIFGVQKADNFLQEGTPDK